MTLTVVEVIGRSQQGRTEPYICRCNDGEVYFIKGRGAGRRSLVFEWLCGHLAQAFGLPIAPFAIATVPNELIESDWNGWLRDLGPGLVFASQRVLANELTHVQVNDVPQAQRRDVLLFDWWVRNGDRCLTEHGGNVNLLWNPAPVALPPANLNVEPADGHPGLVVIDHNLAFDADFSPQIFCETHVFAADFSGVFGDFLLRQSYSERFAQTMAVWQWACDNLPEAWGFVDLEQTVRVNHSLDQLQAILSAAQTPGFWTLPS